QIELSNKTDLQPQREVALRLRENPFNKVCGDCGEANPNWASVNLLLSLCKSCAGTNFSHVDSGVTKTSFIGAVMVQRRVVNL
uniref:Arf-GAP domain-containing protein n=1 Tax=Oryzias melastigma TaxID=30732 RepID=A0A3B3BQW3_ORYME